MSLRESITSIIKLPEDPLEQFIQSFDRKELEKHHLLHQEGKKCRYIYFIESGLMRGYYNANEREITSWFALENTFFTAVDSFFQQKVSRYNIELLEDSIVYELSLSKLETIFNNYPVMEKFGRLLTYEMLALLADRVHALQFQTALERYQTLMRDYPSIIQRCPLGHVASYLGITQETLSRIRGKK